MNKAYRSVWNETTQTWTAVQETAKGRGKRASKNVALTSALIAASGALAGLHPAGAEAATATGNGGLMLCGPNQATGSSYGYTGTLINNLNCTTSGTPVTFALSSGGDTNGAYGLASTTTARIAGYQNGLLELLGTSGISMLNTVTMNSNKITNMAAGTVSSASMDAVRRPCRRRRKSPIRTSAA